MRRTKNLLLAGLLAAALCGPARAQTSAQYWLPHREWSTARDLFAAEHYRLAASAAEHFSAARIHPTTASPAWQQSEAAYIRIAARLRTDEPGAAHEAGQFLKETVDPTLAQRTELALARWYFRKERFAEAIPHYRTAGIQAFSNAEIAAAKFELAYSLFNNRQFEEAAPLFLSIREVEGPYRSAGNYYHGLLAYNRGDYSEALKSFERIDKEPAYRSVVPYYIAEIYYYSGDRSRALSEAQKLMRRPDKLYYDTELHLLAAQVLFEDGRYADALPYFEEYYQKTGKLRKEELYEMAYSHYRVQEWTAAVEKFKPLSLADDSLGQTAMYLLGDCYLQTGDRRGALGAFRLAADAPHVPALREAGLLLSAKLAYEAGYDAEATTRLTRLLDEFPRSAFRVEALTLRSDLFLRSAQYEEALAALEGSPATLQTLRIRQRASYGLGLQKMSAGDLAEADRLLTAATLPDAPADDYRAAAIFWRAEIAYRQEHFADAENLAQEFTQSGGAVSAQRLGSSIRPASAFLLAGHAAFSQEKFAEAERAFAAAASATKGAAPDGTARTAATAQLRQADALMMQREWNKASALYDAALQSGLAGSDAEYARLQKAILLGLRGDNAEKARILQSLADRGASSPYAATARYELAVTRLAEDKPREAIALLAPLTQGTGPMVPKALLRMGAAQADIGADSAALQAYRRVVTEYPASEERAAALDGVRAAAVEIGRPEMYADLLKQTGLTDYSATLDSTYYAAAERAYERQAWGEAVQSLGAYLAQYPNGFFASKAYYYQGRSYEMLKRNSEALRAFDTASAMPLHAFSEAAAQRGATLAEVSGDTTAAENFYARLRGAASGTEGLQTAYLGLARRAADRRDWALTTALTDTLQTIPELRETVRTETALLRGRALLATNNAAGALEQFAIAEKSPTASIAAESRYRRAEALFAQNKLTEAETAADAAIKAGGADRWVLRSYLLIAEVLVKSGDFFNAKATLQSLSKNAKDPAVRAEAAARLAQVSAQEKEGSKLKTDEDGGPNTR